MAKKKKGPPSKRDGDNACGALSYATSILDYIQHYRELTDDYESVSVDRIPIKIRIHKIGSNGVVKYTRIAPILYCTIVNGAICLGTHEHLLKKET